ncbi:MAG: hypothetical protein FJZ90_08125 [Chloroflexi bacterium]|nr:hypothetical protein [Chloroflexota bacterium]
MDWNTVVVIVVALFALVAIAAFVRYKQGGKVNIKGPGGMGVNVDATNPPPVSQPGVRMKDVESGRNTTATDGTGRGVDMEGVKSGQDTRATTSPPKKE